MNAITRHFHCKDVGYDCDWQLEGQSEDEMLPVIEKHAAEVHNQLSLSRLCRTMG